MFLVFCPNSCTSLHSTTERMFAQLKDASAYASVHGSHDAAPFVTSTPSTAASHRWRGGAAGLAHAIDAASQSTARVRNDRIGWIGCGGANGETEGLPALRLVARLLRAMPAAVEEACGWRLTVPTIVMAGDHDGRQRYRSTIMTVDHLGG